MKMIAGVIILAALLTPAIAAEEFYVVQDVASKKCLVIDKPPANASVKLMTEDKPFPTRAAAEAAMKQIKGCATS
jgi:hypothetical protein